MNRDTLRQSLMKHEGLRLTPYKCTAGKVTIGYGRNLDDVGMTNDEAAAMLESDIDRCIAELDRVKPGWKTHDSARQNVLIEMVFNLGMPRLLGFKNMWAAVDRKDYVEASKQMLDSRWAVQVGQRAKTLAETMRTGK
jgi:lysozyme